MCIIHKEKKMERRLAVLVALLFILPRCSVSLNSKEYSTLSLEELQNEMDKNEIVNKMHEGTLVELDGKIEMALKQININDAKTNLEKKFSDLEIQLNNWQEQSKKHTDTLDTISLQMKQLLLNIGQCKSYTAQNNDVLTKLEALAETIPNAKEASKLNEVHIAEYVRQINISNMEINQLQSSLLSAKLKLQENDCQIKSQQSTIDKKNVEIGNLSASIAQMNPTICEAQSNTGDKEQNQQINLNLIKIKDERIASLEKELIGWNTSYVNNTKLREEYSIKPENLSNNTRNVRKHSPSGYSPTSSNSCLGLNGRIKIQLLDFRSFYVLCDEDIVGPGWMIVQRRFDGSVDFNRTWDEYGMGFGAFNGEFFLGLRKLHLLTSQRPHELYILLIDSYNNKYYAHYNDFRVGSLQTNYTLESLGSYTGNASDSLRDNEKAKFSTADHNYQNANYDCMSLYDAPWWYGDKSCGNSNLNGRYSAIDAQSKILWYNKNLYIHCKAVYMLIRPK